ncbi:DUF3306 domain-containing protein [Limnohabitans sp. 63ED37-2]|uniref:DUF3306 domain-containing protein n=1 Tax=Limnohabitans sp. 63ED37-2 TaxID=1678128 RepID=UPI00070639CD|nr:DUF3306 domain-containing protein [Limnohabitans sp. 63ED37-2]ALK89443.1 hypothetical protein L63ED372_02240 [Limnohabitans sp. 63ED37-2]
MSEHFFSRWSQRKQAVAKGLPVAEPVAPASPTELPGVPGPSELQQRSKASPPSQAAAQADSQSSETPAQPLPSLDDARALTPESDFQPFMRPGVTADVRNVAMKKLFTDPHFNVMDGLDIYIGDYNTPDPLPAGMLEKMVGAQLLGLLDKPDEAAAKTATPAGAVPTTQGASSDLGGNPDQSPATQEGSPVVAQSPTSLTDSAGPASPVLQPHVNAHPEHDHPDLQLQPNHAPASPSPGPSTG